MEKPKLTPEEHQKFINVIKQIIMDGWEAGLSNEEIQKWTIDDYIEAMEENFVEW